MNHCKSHFQTTDKVLTACGFSRSDLPPEGQVASQQKNDSWRIKPADTDSLQGDGK